MTASEGGDTDQEAGHEIESAAIDITTGHDRATGAETRIGMIGEDTVQEAVSISDEKTDRSDTGTETLMRSGRGHVPETGVGDATREAGRRMRGLAGGEIEDVSSRRHHCLLDI